MASNGDHRKKGLACKACFISGCEQCQRCPALRGCWRSSVPFVPGGPWTVATPFFDRRRHKGSRGAKSRRSHLTHAGGLQHSALDIAGNGNQLPQLPQLFLGFMLVRSKKQYCNGCDGRCRAIRPSRTVSLQLLMAAWAVQVAWGNPTWIPKIHPDVRACQRACGTTIIKKSRYQD